MSGRMGNDGEEGEKVEGGEKRGRRRKEWE
jgi:hypothetical protein